MSGYGYTLRMGVVANATTDGKAWYGLQLFGTSAKASAPQIEWQPSYGFAARPLPANDDGTGCNALYSLDGQFAWLAHDPRYNDRAPPLTDGASAQWNALGAFVLQDYATATTTIYQPSADRAKAHKITIGVDGDDKQLIDLLHASGACLTITDTEAQLRHTGNAYVEVKPDAINLNGAVNAPTGLSVGGAGAQSVPLMPQLLSYMTALETLLSTIAAATTPPTAPAVTAFSSAMAALKTAMQSQMLKGL